MLCAESSRWTNRSLGWRGHALVGPVGTTRTRLVARGFHTAPDQTSPCFSPRSCRPLTATEARCASSAGPPSNGPATPRRDMVPPRHIAPPAGLLPSASLIKPPQRIVQAEQGVISSWPRKHRQIFALADGKRSIEKIAAMLKQPPSVVEEIVNDLQSLGVIRR